MWKFDVYEGRDGWRWRLRATNGQIVASSNEAFASMANARHAAENVKANAGSATIIISARRDSGGSALAALFGGRWSAVPHYDILNGSVPITNLTKTDMSDLERVKAIAQMVSAELGEYGTISVVDEEYDVSGRQPVALYLEGREVDPEAFLRGDA